MKKRGPKEKPEKDKKVPVRIWVKKKHQKRAAEDAKIIEQKYA